MGSEDTEALNPEDLLIECWSDTMGPDYTVRITHISTRISVEDTSHDQHSLTRWLLEKLRMSLPR